MKKLFINLFVMLIAISLCVFLIELILIVFHQEPLKAFLEDPGGRHLILKESKNKSIQYELIPHAKGYAFGTYVQINRYGFRDREYDLNKGNSYRIIALGDSVTFGTSLPIASTYSKKLEILFQGPGKRKVEVINMGCGGYNISQVVSLLEEKGLRFSPDMVVYGFCLNDLMLRGSPNSKYITRNFFTQHKSWFRFRFVQLVASYLYKLKHIRALENEVHYLQRKQIESSSVALEESASNIKVEDYSIVAIGDLLRESKKENVPHFAWSYASPERIKLMQHSFDMFKALAEQHHFKVVILIIPFLGKDNEVLFPSIYEIIKKEATLRNFHVINIANDIRKDIAQLRLDDIHPNASGHSLLAQALYGYVSNSVFNGQ